MISPSTLRYVMNRYGYCGTRAVAICPTAYNPRHTRAKLVPALACATISLLVTGMVRSWKVAPNRQSMPVRIRVEAVTQREHRHNVPTSDYRGEPLFKKTTKILHTVKAWSWEGAFHPDYFWLNDREFLFGESYHTQDMGRFEYAHFFKYNIRTRHKTPVKSLEQWVSMFYHCQAAVSPNGRWLLWQSVDGGTSVAAIDGSYHREWNTPDGWDSSISWERDSLHWSEARKSSQSPALTRLSRYDIHRSEPISVRTIPERLTPNDIESNGLTVTSSAVLLVVSRRDNGNASAKSTTAIRPASKSLLPATLVRPNIVDAQPSPDGKSIAVVVGHGMEGPTRERDDANIHRAPTHFRDYTLFICNSNGSGTHEIGSWKEPVYPNILLDFEDLRWLPGSRTLSFFYKDTMYTVPAD